MKVTAYKTKKVIVGDRLTNILDTSLSHLSENDIVVITSKIVSICEGNIVKNDGAVTKELLIQQESDRYIKDEEFYQRTQCLLTVTKNILIASAGIDESNGNGDFILWPKDEMKSASDIWEYLRKKHTIKNLGIIITDSHIVASRRGTVGMGLAWCGFNPIVNYIGREDIFGDKLKVTKSSNLDGLAAAAVVVMGEGSQQTPLAVIKEVPFVEFQNRIPNQEEIAEMKIKLEDDMFAPILTAVKWEKGGA